MLIRRLRETDIDQAVELEKLVYERTSGRSLHAGDRFMAWFTIIDQELAIGAFDNDRLIGLQYARDVNPGPGQSRFHNDCLIIHPSYQYKGIGKHLFESMLAMIDSEPTHLSSIAHIGEDNVPAQRLHEKFSSHRVEDGGGYVSDGRRYRTWERQPFAHILDLPEPI